jgi:hypothetical protein
MPPVLGAFHLKTGYMLASMLLYAGLTGRGCPGGRVFKIGPITASMYIIGGKHARSETQIIGSVYQG